MVMMRVTLNACSDADQPLSPDDDGLTNCFLVFTAQNWLV